MNYPVWDQYVKWVTEQELKSYLMIDRLRPVLGDITPKIIKIAVDPDQRYNCPYVLITERYSTTLKKLMDMKNYEKSIMVMEKAKFLVEELHCLKILHTDLYEDNIVYDEPTDRVSLIDFDGTVNLTKFLKKVTPDLNINNPLTEEDRQFVAYAEIYEDAEIMFTNKDDYLFQLEMEFFKKLKRRIEYLK
jgi:hypothetical protein